MSRRSSIVAVALAALFGAGIVLAQDPGTPGGPGVKKDNQQAREPLDKEKPLIGSELKGQCENAIKTKDYLKDLKVTVREDGSGRIFCEGSVPTKVHACALYLTCMSINGVAMVDLSKLRIELRGGDSISPARPTQKAGTDVQGGLDKSIAAKRLGMYAVILNPDERGVTTTPAGARTFVQNDVIVIGDVPASALPNKGAPRSESPQGNPANQDPSKNTQTPARDQPVAPHNPGAYPDSPK